jgi:hypothetical protein
MVSYTKADRSDRVSGYNYKKCQEYDVLFRASSLYFKSPIRNNLISYVFLGCGTG